MVDFNTHFNPIHGPEFEKARDAEGANKAKKLPAIETVRQEQGKKPEDLSKVQKHAEKVMQGMMNVGKPSFLGSTAALGLSAPFLFFSKDKGLLQPQLLKGMGDAVASSMGNVAAKQWQSAKRIADDKKMDIKSLSQLYRSTDKQIQQMDITKLSSQSLNLFLETGGIEKVSIAQLKQLSQSQGFLSGVNELAVNVRLETLEKV